MEPDIPISESALKTKRQRLDRLLGLQQDGNFSKFAAALADSGPGGSARIVLAQPPSRPGTSTRAPWYFKGFVTERVDVCHMPSTFELQVPDEYKEPHRSPLVFQAGEFVEVSCFDTPKDVEWMQMGDLLLLRGLRYSIIPASKEIEVDGLNEENQKGRIVVRRLNDPSISVSVGAVTKSTRLSYKALCKLLSSVPFQEVSKSPFVRPREFGRYVDGKLVGEPVRATVTYGGGKSSTAKTLQDVMLPFQIPTDLIYSRGYPSVLTLFRVRNALDREDLSQDTTDSIREAISSLPNPREQDEYSYQKQGEAERRICLRGSENKQMTFVCLDPNVTCQLVFFSDAVARLGLCSIEIWTNVCTQLLRGLDAMVALRVDIDRSMAYMGEAVSEEFRSEFALVGTGDFLRVNYLKTMQHSGLRVSLKFAVDVLSAKNSKATLDSRHLRSPYTITNRMIQSFKAGSPAADDVQGFFLNEYTGDAERDLADPSWQVYFIPSNDLAPDGTEVEVLRMQNFFQKNSDPEAVQKNEEYIKGKWGDVLRRCGYVVARSLDKDG